MYDGSGRKIDYLRVSVTDRCNYRCKYCMGEDGVDKREHRDILSYEEIAEIARAAADCGVTKLRLTGGEPLVRRGLPDLCRQLREIPGLRELAITTNGSLLGAYAAELRAAGVDRLNVSLDTLDPEKFRAVTRCGELSEAIGGLRAADEAGFTGTKLNTVLIGGFNEDEIPAFVALTRDRPYSVRFIELMPMGACAAWPEGRFVSADEVPRAVPALEPAGTDGVAELWRVPGWAGTVGLIRPMSRAFCARCSRLRLTADGKLKPCLHSDEEIPVRGLHGEALTAAIREAAAQKPERHHLCEEHRSETGRNMNEIGG